jgi:F420-non-reducing hydrogenase small subunit
VEIVFWPVAMDIKYADLDGLPGLDATLVSGSIRNEENEHMTKMLRQKSKLVLAFGSCACEGGTLGLGNLSSKDEILRTVYDELPATNNPGGARPSRAFSAEGILALPPVSELNLPIDKVIKVDYYLSGCPPPVDLIEEFFQKTINRKLPEAGSYIGPDESVCDGCERERISERIKTIDRSYKVKPSTDRCFLEQGILCVGPATRGGCEAKCTQANMPCAGCGGRLHTLDHGARMIGALGALLAMEDDKNTLEFLEGLKDPVGSLYRYCFSDSLIGKGVRVDSKGRHGTAKRT